MTSLARTLHAAMAAGMALFGGTLVLLSNRGLTPLLRHEPTIGLVFAGVGVVILAIAVAVLRARVPQRQPSASPDAYWGSEKIRGRAIVLWAVIEAAGLVAMVGYLISGGRAPAAVAAGALGIMVLYRPSRLEDDA